MNAQPKTTMNNHLTIAILTVSDTRTEETDRSGHTLVELLEADAYQLAAKVILHDNKYLIRAQLSQWIADSTIGAVIITGGTGLTDRDITPEAVEPLLDKNITGFGELFRTLSYDEIGTSTLQSRAFAGIANGTFIFALPGSAHACRTAWEKILRQQFNPTHKPCNFQELLPRIHIEQ